MVVGPINSSLLGAASAHSLAVSVRGDVAEGRSSAVDAFAVAQAVVVGLTARIVLGNYKANGKMQLIFQSNVNQLLDRANSQQVLSPR